MGNSRSTRCVQPGMIRQTGALLVFSLSAAGCSDTGKGTGQTGNAADHGLDDAAILRAVSDDLLTASDFSRFPPAAGRANTKKVLLDATTPGPSPYLAAEQIQSDLPATGNMVVPHYAQVSLYERNAERGPWDPARFEDSSSIVLEDLTTFSLSASRSGGLPCVFDKHPDASAWIQAWLPGYSKDGNTAVVRLWIGPTAHGARGTFLLRRVDGEWRVLWRHIVYFL